MKYLFLTACLVVGFLIARHNGETDIVSVLSYSVGVPLTGLVFWIAMIGNKNGK